MSEKIETLPETFSAGLLRECLDPIPRGRPVYVIADGQKRNITELNDRVTDCVELHAASQWIPCSERLPSKYGSHLVTCDSLVEYCGYDQTLNRWYDLRTGYEKVGVTAWQEKPEPYQENA